MPLNVRARSSSCRVAADDGAALGRRQVLGGEERERRHVGERAHRGAVERAADGVGGVLEHDGAHIVGGPGEAGGVDRVTGVVDTGDDLGALGDRRGRGLGVEVAGVRRDVGEADRRTEHRGAGRGREEGQRRRDHLVAAADARSGIRDVQGRGPGGHRDGAARQAGDRRDVGLEALDRRTRGQPVAAQHLRHRRDVVLGDGLSAVRQHLRPPSRGCSPSPHR